MMTNHMTQMDSAYASLHHMLFDAISDFTGRETLTPHEYEALLARTPTDMVIDMIIEWLSDVTGYEESYLRDIWYAMVEDAAEDGEAPALNFFIGVTLEQDW